MARMLIIGSDTYLRTLFYEVLAQKGYVVIEAANDYEGFSSVDIALLAYGTRDIWYLIVV